MKRARDKAKETGGLKAIKAAEDAGYRKARKDARVAAEKESKDYVETIQRQMR